MKAMKERAVQRPDEVFKAYISFMRPSPLQLRK